MYGRVAVARSITGHVQFGVDGANRGSPVTVTAGSATLSGITDLTAGNREDSRHAVVEIGVGPKIYPGGRRPGPHGSAA